MNYWLLKTEPQSYSLDDLKKEGQTSWDGVRNYQARNFLKQMFSGDRLFIYHSSIPKPAIVGFGRVVGESYPDPTQFDSQSIYYDKLSTKDKPRWFSRKILFKKQFKKGVSLEEIKIHPKLKNMLVAKKGNRLSVLPVSAKEALSLLAILR